MRVVLAALAVLGLAGCHIAPPPPSVEHAAMVQEAPSLPDRTPRVVRRLVAETRLQAVKNRGMAAELPDPRGRERALAEAGELERELASLEARIGDPDSDNLDEVMRNLQQLDTRVDLLHDKLLGATSRPSAAAQD